MLPYIKEIGKTRSYIGEFRGYNHNARISEYEIYDGYNMSNDEYPVLSTRKPRGVLAEGITPLGLYGKNGLCKIYLDGNSIRFEYNGEEYDDLPFDDKYKGLRRIVGFGARLLIYPDNVWFDTVTEKSGKMNARYPMYSYELCYGILEPGDVSEIDVDGVAVEFAEDEAEEDCIKIGGALDERVRVMISVPDEFLTGSLDEEIFKEQVIEELIIGSDGTLERVGNYYITKGIIHAAGPVNRLRVNNGVITCQNLKNRDFYEYTPDYTKDRILYFDGVEPPRLDFVVECQNRLWGCRKGENRAGAVVNEIYATRLGTYDDWYSYEDTADSPYVASIGTPGEFTGAIALSQNPIFFKENAIHKVYVSSSGAHQIYTYDVRGVQRGSGGSIAVVNETAYFKGVRDVFSFDGTNVSPISDALGDVRYFNALAGADGDKYVMYCEDSTNGRYIFTYDTRKGFWQRELIDERVVLMCEENGRLLIGTDDNGIFSHEASPGEVSESRVRYMLETGEIGFESADARFLCRLDLRVKLGFGSTMTVWVEYDGEGGWCEAVRHRGTTVVPRLETVNILPRRAGHFKIRITGTGEMRLYGMQRIYEESTG